MSTRRRRRASSRSSRAAPATRNPRAMIASVRAGDRDIATHVVADLRAMALELGVDVPARVKKASLVELIRNNVFGDDDDEDDEDDDDDDDDDDNQDENNANANVDSDNGEGVGVPIGGNLPSVGESDEEQQHNNPATPATPAAAASSNPAPSNSEAVTLAADGRHPADVAFEVAGGMIMTRVMYDRCLELTRNQGVNVGLAIPKIEDNVLKFLYERAKGQYGSYNNDSEEERAQNAATILITMAGSLQGWGPPTLPEHAMWWNVPVDPNECRLETIVETAGGGAGNDVRVLKLRFPHDWNTYKFNLPPPWFSRSEKLFFDADSTKVVVEVTKSIVASLQQKKQCPTYKHRQDELAPFYLVNASADVVLMNEHFLKQCPTPSEMASAPTFYVCGMLDSHRHGWEAPEPKPHFFVVYKNGYMSYLLRLLLLILLSFATQQSGTKETLLSWSPSLPPLNLTGSKWRYLVRPTNVTINVLSQTAQSLVLPNVQYRACVLDHTLRTVAWSVSWMPWPVGRRSTSSSATNSTTNNNNSTTTNNNNNSTTKTTTAADDFLVWPTHDASQKKPDEKRTAAGRVGGSDTPTGTSIAALDTNDDGAISSDELATYLRDDSGSRATEEIVSFFKLLDRNSDGKISKAEIKAANESSTKTELPSSKDSSDIADVADDSFSWWTTTLIMIWLESCLIWIRSRFCLVGVAWMIFRRYIFVCFRSSSVNGANPNPKTKTKNIATTTNGGGGEEQEGGGEEQEGEEGEESGDGSEFTSNHEDLSLGTENRGISDSGFMLRRRVQCVRAVCGIVARPIQLVRTCFANRYRELKEESTLEVGKIWWEKLSNRLKDYWEFIQRDDWFGYRESARELLKDAADRDESVAQFVYEDESVFRYFTYRWTPVNLSVRCFCCSFSGF